MLVPYLACWPLRANAGAPTEVAEDNDFFRIILDLCLVVVTLFFSYQAYRFFQEQPYLPPVSVIDIPVIQSDKEPVSPDIHDPVDQSIIPGKHNVVLD
tara:strand:- start:252 stop:545 length:294 start_codon:yes stop_codon:yes gene_type:complete